MLGRRILLVQAITLAWAGFLSPSPSQGADLVQFGEPGWRYVFLQGAVDPAWLTPGFDDSQWAVGSAPFVGVDGCATPGTLWPSTSRILVARKHFGASDTPVDARFLCRVQMQGEIYLNGCQVTSITNFDCPLPGFDERSGCFAFIHSGDNVLVAVMGHGSVPGYWDIQVTGDGVTPTLGGSWGRLKILYRN